MSEDRPPEPGTLTHHAWVCWLKKQAGDPDKKCEHGYQCMACNLRRFREWIKTTNFE